MKLEVSKRGLGSMRWAELQVRVAAQRAAWKRGQRRAPGSIRRQAKANRTAHGTLTIWLKCHRWRGADGCVELVRALLLVEHINKHMAVPQALRTRHAALRKQE